MCNLSGPTIGNFMGRIGVMGEAVLPTVKAIFWRQLQARTQAQVPPFGSLLIGASGEALFSTLSTDGSSPFLSTSAFALMVPLPFLLPQPSRSIKRQDPFVQGSEVLRRLPPSMLHSNVLPMPAIS